MDHQDWNYTVYSSSKVKGDKTKGEQATNKAIQQGKDIETINKNITNKTGQIAGSKMHKLLEEEEYKVETVSLDFKIALMQARQAKKLTQAQLAQKINEKSNVIQDYECGKAIPDSQTISKFERALGVRLPRQKKKKVKADE